MKTKPPRDGRYSRLPWPKACYEFYNPWSGFNPCTLAQGWQWMLSVLRTRWKTNPPELLSIHNRETNRVVAYWDGRHLCWRSGVTMLRTHTLTSKLPHP